MTCLRTSGFTDFDLYHKLTRLHPKFRIAKLAAIRRIAVRKVEERARFELAEEREPLAGLANRCLGPLDYLS